MAGNMSDQKPNHKVSKSSVKKVVEELYGKFLMEENIQNSIR
jgi:hypothetical protein